MDGTTDEAAPTAGPWRTLANDAAVLFGLAGLAVTQPVLDLFGRNPTFFVAGDYTRRQIASFALVVALGPGLAFFALSAAPRLVSRRVAAWSHGSAVAALAGLFGLVVCRTLDVGGLWVPVALALALGLLVAVVERRVRPFRRFLAYLAVGNVAFLASFLAVSPSAELLGGVSYADAGRVRVPPLQGPVVMVVLDEFPLTPLLRPDGSINDIRYPNLAALARRTTWFRNAASQSATTFVSVPSILTGRLVEPDQLPVAGDHPRNLFSLFGPRYPVHRYEVVTDLCPPDTCQRPPPQPLRQALSDAWVVYRHRILPEPLRRALPQVDHAWGRFGEGIGVEPSPSTTHTTTSSGSPDPMARLDDLAEGDAGRTGQFAALARRIDRIGAAPSIHFVHVLLPHHPYELTPWGGTAAATWNPAGVPRRESDPGYDFVYRELRGLQAMQLGAVDGMVGRLVDHLEHIGAWDDTTLVVTSDHGVDISPPGFTRSPDAENLDELYRIPLFVKAPGQVAGETRDDPASTIDVLPSLVDLLGIEADWDFDGHSLFDGSRPRVARPVDSGVEGAIDAATRHAAPFPRGDGWDDLAAVGPALELVGRPAAAYPTGDPSAFTVTLDQQELLDDLSARAGPVPYSLRGTLHGSTATPPELVVALNGTFAGTIGGYRPDGHDSWRFSGLMAHYFVDGPNDVAVYQVEHGHDGPTLHQVARA